MGKTLAARWIARELERPLLTLDLSATTEGFSWTKTANAILDKAARAKATLDKIND